jgi:N6-adenosine-specific RNA methylase IME4
MSRRANRAAPGERSAAFNAAWSSSVDGILAAAAVLVAADRDLDAGVLDGEDYEAFVAGLSVSDKTVIKIRKIGLDVRIHGSRGNLPPSWTTLYALTCLDEDEWQAVEAAGLLKPDLDRAELAHFLAKLKNNETAARIIDLPLGQYATIVIDPPWPQLKIPREVRPNQAGFDYPTMSLDQLSALDIASIAADDCHLWLWSTIKFLPEAFNLVDDWGFSYINEFVWHKPGGMQPTGLQQYNHEPGLYCRKGSPKFLDTTAFPTCFSAPRREHSRKPDEFYDTVRRVCAGPRLDMFSREPRDGFDQHGNQPGLFVPAAAE